MPCQVKPNPSCFSTGGGVLPSESRMELAGTSVEQQLLWNYEPDVAYHQSELTVFWLFSPVAAPHRCLPTPTRGSFFSQSRGTLPESITETGQERSEHHSVQMFLSYLDPDAECPPAASQTELQHPDVSRPPATERTCFTYQSIKLISCFRS